MKTPVRSGGDNPRRMLARRPLVVITLLITGLAFAQNHEITRHTIDGGGGELVGTQFSLHGSVGQPDASSMVESSNFQLSGGFWPGSVNQDLPDGLFADGFED